MNPLPEENSPETYARQLAANGKTLHEIEQLLLRRTHDPELSAAMVRMIRKEYNDRTMKSGKTKVLIALLLLGSSFVITCLNFHAGISFTFIMYSFTITGILLLLWGGYDILH